MLDFIRFVISFFGDWRRITGLFALVQAVGATVAWMEELASPRGLRYVDHFIVGVSIIILAVCSLVLFLIEPPPKNPPVNFVGHDDSEQ